MVNDKPNLYYLSGTSGARWPRHSWTCSGKPRPSHLKVTPLIFDENGRMRPQFCWTFPLHIARKPSEIMKSGWAITGTKGSMQRFFFDSTQLHGEGNLVNNLVFRLKPDPAGDMGGITKDYFKSPPEAVSRFLNARNSVHLPYATHLQS